MTRKELETALANGVPFILHLADGREYPAPHCGYISFPPKDETRAVVWEDDGTVHVLPLLTMTGITKPTV